MGMASRSSELPRVPHQEQSFLMTPRKHVSQRKCFFDTRGLQNERWGLGLTQFDDVADLRFRSLESPGGELKSPFRSPYDRRKMVGVRKATSMGKRIPNI
jgi:hypothetical protein